MSSAPVLRLKAVSFVRNDTSILHDVDWEVSHDERWVVLGANGSGKTSLARIATMHEHPSSGSVELLGEALGRTDVRTLRRRVGFVSASFADLLRPDLTAIEIVMMARFAALEPYWHTYTDGDRDRAGSLLSEMDVGHRIHHHFGDLSSGERQRVLLARAMMTDPGLLVADEPNAGLDLAGREELVEQLDRLAVVVAGPPIILVTHHVEEIPTRFTHLLALRDGEVIAQGPIGQTLSAPLLSDCYGIAVHLGRDGGRWWARKV